MELADASSFEMAAAIQVVYPTGDILAFKQVIDGALKFVEAALTGKQAFLQCFFPIDVIIMFVEQHQCRRNAVDLHFRSQPGCE